MNIQLENRPEPPGRRASMALAVAVHLLLAAFLIYGIRWQTERREAVEVELVRAVPEQKSVPRLDPPLPKPEPRPEPKPEPKAEPKPPPKPDIAVKEKEKPKEPPKPKDDHVQKELQRELDQVKQRKAANAIDAEFAQIKAAQAAATKSKAAEDYMSKIRAKIRGNIVLPPDVKGDPEAVFDVAQLPSGEVLSVKLRKSSGHAALDAAIERAILKSSPLPKPGQGDLFSRNLELRFKPLEE